jgi:hypothetical protein
MSNLKLKLMKKILFSSFLILFAFILKFPVQGQDSTVIASETFGTQAWDLTTGTDTYFASDVTSFSVTNGVWEPSYSIRINAYGSSDAPAPGVDFPSPSRGMSIILAPPLRYAGRWDTIQLNDVNIKNYKDLWVSYGYMLRNGTPYDSSKAGVFVSVKIDAGDWISLDTSDLGWPRVRLIWKYIKMKVPGNVTGNKMSIRIAAGDYNQNYVDDIRISGTSVPVINVPSLSAENSIFYPNPVSDRLYFRNVDNRNVDIMNMNGQIIMSTNNLRSYMNLSGLSQGMYLVRITDRGNSTTISKFIKK